MSSLSPLLEAFVVIEQPRQRFGHWMRALAPLDAPTAPPLASVIAFYDPTADQALLDLRYDELAVGDTGLKFLVDTALLAEVGLIQPAELSEIERRRFVAERLARCTLQVTYRRDVIGALAELVRKIKEQRESGKPKPPPLPLAMRPPRAPSPSEEPLVVAAKGTRDDLANAATEREGGAFQSQTHRRVITRAQRLPTVEMTPQRAAELVAGAREDTMIRARYLRSGRWVPVRVGALSLRGAALLAGALPRVQDRVDLALTFANHRAIVRGVVGKVSSGEHARTSGVASFSLDFELDDVSHRQLAKLLTAARAAHVTIKPAPARATRRFPIEWPMVLGTSRGAIRAEALDASVGGMFVRPAVALELGTVASFSMVLEEGGTPVVGHARVVRAITEAEAKASSLDAGFGLAIVDSSDHDRGRWIAFLARVERRAEKRVLVGATPARLAELQQGLAAVGYVVTGGADPGALVQLANSGERPADAALIDAGWLADGSAAAWIESLFSSRNVPCVTMQGDVRRARVTIDRLLEVVPS